MGMAFRQITGIIRPCYELEKIIEIGGLQLGFGWGLRFVADGHRFGSPGITDKNKDKEYRPPDGKDLFCPSLSRCAEKVHNRFS